MGKKEGKEIGDLYLRVKVRDEPLIDS
jgi:hypothetical protein